MKKQIITNLINDKIDDLQKIINDKTAEQREAGNKKIKGVSRYKQQIELLLMIDDIINNNCNDDVKLSKTSQDKFSRMTSETKVGGHQKIIINEGDLVYDLICKYETLNFKKISAKCEKLGLRISDDKKSIIKK